MKGDMPYELGIATDKRDGELDPVCMSELGWSCEKCETGC